MRPLLKTKTAAEFLGVCTRTILRMVEDQRLKALKTHPGKGGHLLFREEDLLQAIGAEPGEQPTPKRGRPSLEPIA